jgi:hypothetical protein
MSNQRRRGAGESAPSAPDFEPVKLRYRHDGLTPARQVALIQALAESGCVREACARVGISPEAVYKLRRRPDAQSFRLAMDVALDGAADAVEDGVYSRAIHGVEIPHYYKGELVGTHRRHDERLAMFILRYRKPSRYGKHLDRRETAPPAERSALGLGEMLTWVLSDARRDETGLRRRVGTELAQADVEEELHFPNLFRWGPGADAPADEDGEMDEEDFDDLDDLDDLYPGPAEAASSPDVSRTSSTSAPVRNRRMRRKAVAKGRKR